MKNLKRTILPLTLCAAILLANIPVAFAASAPSEKEEVIYVKLTSDGAARDYYAVNIFTLEGGGNLTDYGNYSSVRNMTTTDAITQSGDMLSVTTSADKLYYEGVMTSAELPWNISIRYFLNGRQIDPSDIAGKSGALKIKINISKNEKAAEGFYEAFALQVTAALDTEKCENITASGATLANVGSDKQITYTVLPGKGLDAEITADVHDFEMDGISINGVGMSLDIDIDTSAVTDKVEELQDGVSKLNDGANTVETGVDSIYTGTDAVASGAKELSAKANELYVGMDELQKGANDLKAGLEKMQSSATDIKTGLDGLKNNSDAIRNGSAQVSATLTQLKTAVSGFDALLIQLDALAQGSSSAMNGINGLYNGLDGLNTQLSGINTAALISANNSAITALERAEQTYGADLSAAKGVLAANNTAWDGVAQAQTAIGGQTGLLAGATKLKNDYKTIDDGIQALNTQLADINTGLTALKTAIDDLETAYNDLQTGMDPNLQAYTNGVDAAAAGYDLLYAALYGKNGVADGVSSLQSGITSARNGSMQLSAGATELSGGALKLQNGLAELRTGTSELASGTKELYNKTATMDEDINARIDEMIAEVSGSDIAITSFTSPKNTAIRSVQFVMTSDPIEIADVTVMSDAPETDTSFSQKLADLFA